MPNDLSIPILQTFFGAPGAEDPEGASEVVAYGNGRIYTTNGKLDRIDIFELGEEETQATIDLTLVPGYAGVQSVAVSDDLIAVAIERETTELDDGTVVASNGVVAFYDPVTLELVEIVEVGVLPDQIAFNADGSQLVVANEGEFNEDSDWDQDPAGSISLISIKTVPASENGKAEPMTKFKFKEASFEKLPKNIDTDDIRLSGNEIAVDAEPEYSAYSPDGKFIYTTLQENNAVAVINAKSGKVTDIIDLGTVDHSLEGNGIDPNDRDGVIEIRTYDNLVGLRMPDAIATYEVGGEIYFVTANEGDGRGDYFVEEEIDGGDVIVGISDRGGEARVGDLLEVNGAFGAVTIDASVDTTGLERLVISTVDGDTDGDGDIDVLHAFGGRSFTIFDAEGNVVFESGEAFARLIAEIAPERFQDDDGEDGENRSDAKGVEPEAIEIGEIDGDQFLFIGLERDSGIVVYNITDPANSEYVAYLDGFATGNLGPEVLEFVPAEEAPGGNPLLLASYEISGTTVAYELTADAFAL